MQNLQSTESSGRSKQWQHSGLCQQSKDACRQGIRGWNGIAFKSFYVSEVLADTLEITLFWQEWVDTETVPFAFLFIPPLQPLQSESIRSVFLMWNPIVSGSVSLLFWSTWWEVHRVGRLPVSMTNLLQLPNLLSPQGQWSKKSQQVWGRGGEKSINGRMDALLTCCTCVALSNTKSYRRESGFKLVEGQRSDGKERSDAMTLKWLCAKSRRLSRHCTAVNGRFPTQDCLLVIFHYVGGVVSQMEKTSLFLSIDSAPVMHEV